MIKISKQAAILLAAAWYQANDFSADDALLFARDWANYEPLRKHPFDLDTLRIEHVPGKGFFLRPPSAAELAEDRLAAEIMARWAA